MVPDPNRAKSSQEETSIPAGDGGTVHGIDEEALFTIVRDAVKDALLDVVGTLFLLAIAFVLAIAGAQALVLSTSVPQTAAGTVVLAIGVYVAAATLELIPPVREWV